MTKTLVGKIVDKATARTATPGESPVPYVGRHTAALQLPGIFGLNPRGQEAQMRAMGGMGTLFAIVSLLGDATAGPEWHLYRKAKSGDPDERQEVTSHAAIDLWNKPNPFMHRAEFIKTYQQHRDLVGEGWWVVVSNERFKLPLELWPVRPDRMTPVPHPERYLLGYMYTGPDGEQVALTLDQVIFMRDPNPLDPYRGMGAVQTILTDVESSRYAAEWNRRFFENSSEPGGIIEFEEELSDIDYNRLRTRWNEQHKGVANAHRVALIEQGGKWVPRAFTNRDMQFRELRDVPREIVREAFAFPRPMLGTVDDTNRANMEAAEYIFARWKSVPRLDATRDVLNFRLLPMFGSTAEDLEWDYDSPVPADREADDRELTSKAEAYKILRDAGVHPDDAAEVCGLPKMRVTIAPAPLAEPDAVPVEEGPALADLVIDWLRDQIGDSARRALPAAEAPDYSTGCMLALYPPADLAAQLTVDGGLPADELHLTVAYCGKADTVDPTALRAAGEVLARRAPITAQISGLARFVGGEDGDVIVALIDSADLEDLRRDVLARLAEAGIEVPRDHGFMAHITLTYLKPGSDSPVEEIEPADVTFDALSVVHGDDRTDVHFQAGPPARSTADRRPRAEEADTPELPDLAPVQQSYDQALEQIADDWQRIQSNQVNNLAGQVQQIVDDGDLAALPAMTAPTEEAQRALVEAMATLGADAAGQVTAEAAAQDVTVEPVPPAEGDMVAVAAVVVALLAAGLVAAAAGEALRQAGPGRSGRDVADSVRTHLNGLSEAGTRDRLGGALHKAQHAGRMSTYSAIPTDGGGPVPAYYGSEVLDTNTCRYCREVDGRFLGLDIAQAVEEYPTGGYIRCEGRDRCRGHVVVVWRPGSDKSQWQEKEHVPMPGETP
ncbi:MAG TPA: phage portal protein [Streptosporangiaceae bacterium]|jgi:HK97 family phage portal protein|nr:phage portal protein [Streptosporangiaceae bacterium]